MGAINYGIKRTDLIVESWRQHGTGYGLCLLGKLQDGQIIDQVKLNPNFIHAYVDPSEVSRFIYYADFLCLASAQEGFPNILIEGLLHSKLPYLQRNYANADLLDSQDTLVDFKDPYWINELNINISQNKTRCLELLGRYDQEFISFMNMITETA